MANGILLDIGPVFEPVGNKFPVRCIRAGIPFVSGNDPFPDLLGGTAASENQTSGFDGIQKL
jgi:hypothetical protein